MALIKTFGIGLFLGNKKQFCEKYILNTQGIEQNYIEHTKINLTLNIKKNATGYNKNLVQSKW